MYTSQIILHPIDIQMGAPCSPIDSLTKAIVLQNSMMTMNNNPDKDKDFRIIIGLQEDSTRFSSVNIINNKFIDFDYKQQPLIVSGLVGLGQVQYTNNLFVSMLIFY